MIFALVYSGDHPTDDGMVHVNECYTIDYDINTGSRLSLQYDATVTRASGEQNDVSQTLDFYPH